MSSPGILYTRNEIGTSLIPKSTHDIEDLKEPLNFVKDLLKYISKEDLIEIYEIPLFDDIVDLLDNICKKYNFMIKVINKNKNILFNSLKFLFLERIS